MALELGLHWVRKFRLSRVSAESTGLFAIILVSGAVHHFITVGIGILASLL